MKSVSKEIEAFETMILHFQAHLSISLPYPGRIKFLYHMSTYCCVATIDVFRLECTLEYA